MEAKTIGTVLVSSILIKQVSCYYCEGDKCSDDEYCCGYNTCCSSYKVWELWYFWFGLCFFLILLSMCSCLWRYRPSKGVVIISTSGGYNYSPLHDDPISIHTSSEDTNQVHTRSGPGISHSAYSPSDSGPPAYTSTSNNFHKNKLSSPPPAYSDVFQKEYYHAN
ncbi:hypothetical protein LOTGIDRAFT_174586 [Lottia gigantea]|uniref:WW domain binding protein VOPP1 n=1 Tax=Lottia gigantea TaxID=225164 RepID=V4A026_LOTGI|nr:hypothetical protein LOTGIDRAFT_174586 [Lottia gigantea]ESO97153.1 hypothetical protein LOTGIDRAFT_174586 [Lottia gigantea]